MPHEYYSLLPDEWVCLVNGYRQKVLRSSYEKRHATFITIAPLVKDLTFEKFCSNWWRLPGDEQPEEMKLVEPPTVDAELWSALKKQMSPQQPRKPQDEKAEYEKILSKHNLKSNG